MEVRVKTIWAEGIEKVGIPEKYVKRTLRRKEDLVVIGGKRDMVIPLSKIKERITGYSEEFEDKWDRKPYRLVYFKWIPETDDERIIRMCL